MSDIQQCQSLVAQLGGEYNNEDRTTYIDITPEKILQISTMALWAQSTSGQRQINLGLPSLKTWLKNLAANGPGRPRHTKVSHTNLSSRSLTAEPPLPYRAWVNWTENHYRAAFSSYTRLFRRHPSWTIGVSTRTAGGYRGMGRMHKTNMRGRLGLLRVDRPSYSVVIAN